MVKTTVYLDKSDAAALKRVAASSGRSQAEIIREAVSRAVRDVPERKFSSFSSGRSGDPTLARQADDILRKEMGRSKL